MPYNEAIDPQAVADMLKAHPEITIVSVCHHDTPSGTINPIDEIGALVSAHGGYLIVDAVSSFGGMKTHPEDCKADIYVTGPNKCLGAPPGLTMMGVSDRAWAKMKANPAGAARLDALASSTGKMPGRRTEPFPFTPSVAEMNGLDVALDLYLDEGPEAVWARHALTAKAMRAGVTRDGPVDLGGRREDRLADDDRRSDAGRRRREGAAAGGARSATASCFRRVAARRSAS